MVDSLEWDLTRMSDRRRMFRLLYAPEPESLVTAVAKEAMEAAASGSASLNWQAGDLMQDCSRAIAVFPIDRTTFDAFFNGRSGYRAQYYLSLQEGVAFNRMLVIALLQAACEAYQSASLQQDWPTVRKSLDGPWSKVWICDDTKAFNSAPHGELRPVRWAERDPDHIALCAPLPELTAIDFKGTWLSSVDNELRQDPLKSSRDSDLHERGHA